MINGLYSATTGMFVQQTRLDVIAGNVANASVPGYKGERILFRSFPDHLRVESQKLNEDPVELGPLGGGAAVDQITTNMAPGDITYTGLNTDLIIFQDGFFHLETPLGERLSRNGSFYRDAEGYLRNSDGNLLLGQQGPIQVVEEDFTVNTEGEIFVDRQTPTADGRILPERVQVDQLRISVVEDPATLERQGNSLYFVPTGVERPAQPGEARVGQGYLERSNVKAVEESVKMVDTFRAYEAAQRLVLAMDGILDQAINEVGRA
jgi:flagellar basal-body rod protein FlgF